MKEIVFDLLCVGRPAKIFLSHGPEVNIQLYLITLTLYVQHVVCRHMKFIKSC